MNTSETAYHHYIPRQILLAAGGMMLLTVVLVGLHRYGGWEETRVPDAPIAEQRAILFEERDNGMLAVLSAEDGSVLDLAGPAEKGFLRVTLSAMNHGRRVNGVAQNEPFLVRRRTDNSLSLYDPATDQSIDLRAFGPQNTRAYINFLPSRSSNQ